MACSKVFSGDLPELLNGIIQFFKNDYKTLRSCILVNRLLCRLTIPLLWENPFSVIDNFDLGRKKYQFIEIYLHELNDDDKIKLKEYGINCDLFPSNTLFNYPSFIKYFSTEVSSISIDEWIENNKTLPIIENLTLQIESSRELIGFIFLKLIKIFIKNEVKLHTFNLEISNTLNFIGIKNFNNTFEIILKNPNFIYNIKILKFHLNIIISNLTCFKCFYINCDLISSFYIFNPLNQNISSYDKNFSQIINSQHNLKKILFQDEYFLNNLKNSNCSNTLKVIILYEIDFKNIVIFKEVFENLNVLESIHFLYCSSLNSGIIQQIINLTKPFKLKSLFLNEQPDILEIVLLQSLLRKTGDYIENIGFKHLISNKLRQQFFELTKNYCKNIKFFDLLGFDNQNIYLAFDSIKNIRHNLNYLTINLYKFYQFDWEFTLSSVILFNLGQILPYKLEYLSLSLDDINIFDLEVFFKKSENTFINKLLIYNRLHLDSDDILPCIKNYIMKEKKVRYFAMKSLYPDGKSKDLFSLKDEVKEFEFYNIIIQNYDSLNIRARNFIM
ncbi:uncharacterized protein OCT59_003738 [Rhizophagus irregularis]|uniref:F-box domain-containing protein n=1 Tax=Rhizophagus irregularis (strain DAOM 181602 / DAOM 197198 / MUCL 43194) TaxID=747089 RepID=A0A2P4PH68_RHIID|nr:hypothetical protein GLOIN_2v1881105 [Rhizophagus irregularis DAOM 181602=DAOM 197198]POG64731.1 hypothetical protein GLOIN_2v1881105 [Rhizophagus irregularis DAOM 181602=DAOM 197198]UZO12190.1 hypothetical protein OCT59_003738 [Rhizophagus irregularis]|eukprot:XP_025171597.1 hypothetical protein GLOIN_2v1881105 [Rhizophagus irregularis DAOM 181602=DAOM 197198]